jgi:hypothetical protein
MKIVPFLLGCMEILSYLCRSINQITFIMKKFWIRFVAEFLDLAKSAANARNNNPRNTYGF